MNQYDNVQFQFKYYEKTMRYTEFSSENGDKIAVKGNKSIFLCMYACIYILPARQPSYFATIIHFHLIV